ncbi:hypothetical protein [Pelagibius sp.]|uniref:hypothetical protein n=1 Tax=Pelagibius sp. TaxID=1931238 RepID=UPI003B4FFBE4
MAEPQIISFVPAHLADIDPPVLDPAQMQRFASAYRPTGPAFTLTEAGRALGCAGLVLDGRTGRAWAFLSNDLRRRPQLLHRTVSRALPALVDHYDLERVTAEAHKDFTAARRWLERLGFRFAGLAPRYEGTTETYARYCLWADSQKSLQ